MRRGKEKPEIVFTTTSGLHLNLKKIRILHPDTYKTLLEFALLFI